MAMLSLHNSDSMDALLAVTCCVARSRLARFFYELNIDYTIKFSDIVILPRINRIMDIKMTINFSLCFEISISSFNYIAHPIMGLLC